MIDLESISIEGFLSWGPYATTLQLANMEQCFIIGVIADQAEGRSNGAGKSALMQAIVWCLSGKTVYNQNPGDKVLNWFSSGNTRVALRLKDGSEITRIRTRSGDTELLFRRGIREIINCTLSTTGNQQRMLDSELKFDYGLFCGSVFFSQYRQPWLAMQDQARRQAFEKIMGIDRLSIYAEVAKGKYDKALVEQDKRKAKIAALESSIAGLSRQLQLTQTSSTSFETSRAERRAAKLRQAAEYEERADKFVLIDIAALTKKWEIVNKINAKIAEIQSQIAAADKEISGVETARLRTVMKLKEQAQADKNIVIHSIGEEKTKLRNKKDEAAKKIEGEIAAYNKKILVLRQQISEQNGIVNTQSAIIKRWVSKSGKICTECERELPEDYANSKIDGPKAIKDAAERKVLDLQKEIGVQDAEIVLLTRKIEQLQNTLTTETAALTEKEKSATKDIDAQLDNDTHTAANDAATMKAELVAKKQQLEQLVAATKAKLATTKPEMTVNEATTKNSQRDMLLDNVRRAKQEADNIAAETNTHGASILQLGQEIRKQEDQIKTETKDMETYDIIISHLIYIQKAYSDRRKIKSYLISRHQPYFNSRLHHYLDLFGLDIRVSLTDSLGIESNMWGYDFQSGGERGRTDLAFMFAVFDLHQGMHGPQSNILVLDEPEKALDESGRQMLISVIKDDLATRFESIFIISHSDCFHDVFPHQITVERTDRFSHITDIR